MDLTKRIIEIRESKKISKSEVAQKLNIDLSNYFRVEKKGSKLTYEQIEGISNALGVSVKELLFAETDAIQQVDAKELEDLRKEVENLKKELRNYQQLVNLSQQIVEDKNKIIGMLESKIKPLDKLNNKFFKGWQKICVKHIPVEDLKSLTNENSELYSLEKIITYFKNKDDMQTLEKIMNDYDILSEQLDKDKARL